MYQIMVRMFGEWQLVKETDAIENTQKFVTYYGKMGYRVELWHENSGQHEFISSWN